MSTSDVTLPPMRWRAREGLDALVQLLGAAQDEVRFVGGAVRDALVGIEASDIDLATLHPPQEVMARLRAAGVRVVPTGLAHGTVTAVLAGGPVEITTLRRDVATDGRHAEVAFTNDWHEDAARRDFTINALYADPMNGRIHDYFGGVADLAQGRVRFIGDPLRRIAEDHLRILRFFRFMARFGDKPDADGLAACAARANDLMALSRERIADEVLKLLVTRHAPRIVALMVAHAILRPVLPEIDAAGAERLTALAAREHAHAVEPDAVRRLAALLPADPGVAGAVAARLKLSNARRKRLENAVQPLPPGTSARGLAYRTGVEGARDRLLLHGDAGEIAAGLAALDGWTPPRLPLGGGDLIAMGLPPGPDVARILREIETTWIAEGFPDDARVRALAERGVDQLLRRPMS